MGGSIYAKGIEMTSRNIVTRIEKLEARRRSDDKMLLLWRMPDENTDVAVLAAKRAGEATPTSLGAFVGRWRWLHP